jgi:hypothetical protein
MTLLAAQVSYAIVRPAQGQGEVSPLSAVEIRQVRPNQASAGSTVTLEIEGSGFARGAYVSFSNPAVRVVSTRWLSETRLETQVAVEATAPAGVVSLYVSNTAGPVAEVPFTVMGGTAAPAPGVTPAAPSVEPSPAEWAAPEVAKVEPSRAARGSQLSVKVTGKRFASGAKVAFSNPGILVSETVVAKPTELQAHIQVATDAPVGATGLFVVNPDESEAEASFEVVESQAVAGGASTAPTAAAQPLSFSVMNLGELAAILQSRNKPVGTLTLGQGTLRYEEEGKEVFSSAAAEIKEIGINSILGMNTGTFHVILNSGQTYNFAPASLRPADCQSIVDSLQHALK